MPDIFYNPSVVWDVLRVLTASCALWLTVLVMHFGYGQRQRNVRGNPHFASYLSYAFGLVVIAVFRFTNLGEAPDVRMWIAAIIVALGMYGVLRKVKLGRPFSRTC